MLPICKPRGPLRPGRGRRRGALGPPRGRRDRPVRRRPIPEPTALYLAPASPSKILAVHLTYESRVREYDARTPPEPSYFVKPPTTLNGHRRPVLMAKGAQFLNYEGELAVIIGERMKGVPIERRPRLRRRLYLRERHRHARLPPCRPRCDAAGQGSRRLPPARPRARARLGVRLDRLRAPDLPQRRRSCRRRRPTTSCSRSPTSSPTCAA